MKKMYLIPRVFLIIFTFESILLILFPNFLDWDVAVTLAISIRRANMQELLVNILKTNVTEIKHPKDL